MMHRIGVYWCPGHNRPTDLGYMRALQPPVVRILDPDVQHISDAHAAAPGAIIMPRLWLLDDNNGQQKRAANLAPIITAKQHAWQWDGQVEEWETMAQERGIPFPSRRQLIVSGINEPNDGLTIQSQIDYNVELLDRCREHGLRAAALCLGVGWPANKGDGTPPDWTPYEPVREAIRRGDHVLDLHEYWYDDPSNGWGWLAGRHTKLPESWDVPIIIGECGVDRYVDAERWGNEGGNRGWRGNLEPWEYAADIDRFAEECDPRVIAVLPFSTDYRANDWESFDTAAAHAELIILADEEPEPPLPKPPADSHFERALAWIFEREGGYSDDPEDHGNWTGGRKGVGELVGTKYGISGATWGNLYDIRNLTQEQAAEIYRQHYWLASRANEYAWPLSLLIFDTAVLHGAGTATKWLREVGPDPYGFAARRLKVYTGMDNWRHFGAGWVNRMADLMAVIGRDT